MKLMALRSKRRGWDAAAVALLLLAACPVHAVKHGAGDTTNQVPVPAPIASIAVGPLGFLAPSPAYLDLRLAWASLNFIDDNHLLFTFHANSLLRRIPEDTGGGEEQMVHADVLEISSGKVVRQADWRMHDRGHYIWALKDGQFLVRQSNTLCLTNSSLELRPYLNFETQLQGVEVSPGRTMLLLELAGFMPPEENDADENKPSLLPPSPGSPAKVRPRRTDVVLLRPGESKILAKTELRVPVAVPLNEDGVLEVFAGKQPKVWMIEKELIYQVDQKPGDATRQEEVGEVRSACTPQMQPLSRNVVLVQNCPTNGTSGNEVSALTLDGKVLWQSRWQSKYIWPTFDYAENGSRFAYESMQMNRDIGTIDSFGEADVVAQPVGVFNTETGKLELVLNASPVLSEGQNFALSADGRRFAILRNGAIEVYDLPPAEAREPEKPGNKK
jgi:hypothetical protein